MSVDPNSIPPLDTFTIYDSVELDQTKAEAKDGTNAYVTDFSIVANVSSINNNNNNNNIIVDHALNHPIDTANRYPVNITETITTNYVSFEIFDVKVSLFQSCEIIVALISQTEQKRLVRLIMDINDYTNWNNDDQYLIDWVNNKINTTDIFSA